MLLRSGALRPVPTQGIGIIQKQVDEIKKIFFKKGLTNKKECGTMITVEILLEPHKRKER